MKILIVEDQPAVAELLTRYLRPVAREIIVAKDMATALAEMAKATDFDLITLDLKLPDSNAQQTLQNIRDIKKRNEDALVVVITGMLAAGQEDEARKLGADAYIEKPESLLSQRGFYATLENVYKSLKRQPRRYQHYVDLLEKVTKKLTDKPV